MKKFCYSAIFLPFFPFGLRALWAMPYSGHPFPGSSSLGSTDLFSGKAVLCAYGKQAGRSKVNFFSSLFSGKSFDLYGFKVTGAFEEKGLWLNQSLWTRVQDSFLLSCSHRSSKGSMQMGGGFLVFSIKVGKHLGVSLGEKIYDRVAGFSPNLYLAVGFLPQLSKRWDHLSMRHAVPSTIKKHAVSSQVGSDGGEVSTSLNPSSALVLPGGFVEADEVSRRADETLKNTQGAPKETEARSERLGEFIKENLDECKGVLGELSRAIGSFQATIRNDEVETLEEASKRLGESSQRRWDKLEEALEKVSKGVEEFRNMLPVGARTKTAQALDKTGPGPEEPDEATKRISNGLENRSWEAGSDSTMDESPKKFNEGLQKVEGYPKQSPEGSKAILDALEETLGKLTTKVDAFRASITQGNLENLSEAEGEVDKYFQEGFADLKERLKEVSATVEAFRASIRLEARRGAPEDPDRYFNEILVDLEEALKKPSSTVEGLSPALTSFFEERVKYALNSCYGDYEKTKKLFSRFFRLIEKASSCHTWQAQEFFRGKGGGTVFHDPDFMEMPNLLTVLAPLVEMKPKLFKAVLLSQDDEGHPPLYSLLVSSPRSTRLAVYNLLELGSRLGGEALLEILSVRDGGNTGNPPLSPSALHGSGKLFWITDFYKGRFKQFEEGIQSNRKKLELYEEAKRNARRTRSSAVALWKRYTRACKQQIAWCENKREEEQEALRGALAQKNSLLEIDFSKAPHFYLAVFKELGVLLSESEPSEGTVPRVETLNRPVDWVTGERSPTYQTHTPNERETVELWLRQTLEDCGLPRAQVDHSVRGDESGPIAGSSNRGSPSCPIVEGPGEGNSSNFASLESLGDGSGKLDSAEFQSWPRGRDLSKLTPFQVAVALNHKKLIEGFLKAIKDKADKLVDPAVREAFVLGFFEGQGDPTFQGNLLHWMIRVLNQSRDPSDPNLDHASVLDQLWELLKMLDRPLFLKLLTQPEESLKRSTPFQLALGFKEREVVERFLCLATQRDVEMEEKNQCEHLKAFLEGQRELEFKGNLLHWMLRHLSFIPPGSHVEVVRWLLGQLPDECYLALLMEHDQSPKRCTPFQLALSLKLREVVEGFLASASRREGGGDLKKILDGQGEIDFKGNLLHWMARHLASRAPGSHARVIQWLLARLPDERYLALSMEPDESPMRCTPLRLALGLKQTEVVEGFLASATQRDHGHGGYLKNFLDGQQDEGLFKGNLLHWVVRNLSFTGPDAHREVVRSLLAKLPDEVYLALSMERDESPNRCTPLQLALGLKQKELVEGFLASATQREHGHGGYLKNFLDGQQDEGLFKGNLLHWVIRNLSFTGPNAHGEVVRSLLAKLPDEGYLALSRQRELGGSAHTPLQLALVLKGKEPLVQAFLSSARQRDHDGYLKKFFEGQGEVTYKGNLLHWMVRQLSKGMRSDINAKSSYFNDIKGFHQLLSDMEETVFLHLVGQLNEGGKLCTPFQLALSSGSEEVALEIFQRAKRGAQRQGNPYKTEQYWKAFLNPQGELKTGRNLLHWMARSLYQSTYRGGSFYPSALSGFNQLINALEEDQLLELLSSQDHLSPPCTPFQLLLALGEGEAALGILKQLEKYAHRLGDGHEKEQYWVDFLERQGHYQHKGNLFHWMVRELVHYSTKLSGSLYPFYLRLFRSLLLDLEKNQPGVVKRLMCQRDTGSRLTPYQLAEAFSGEINPPVRIQELFNIH